MGLTVIKYDVWIGDTDYFGRHHTVDGITNLQSLINSNQSKYIRVQTEKDRILLAPELDGMRQIEGYSDINFAYMTFNDVRHPKSNIGCDNKGPGGTYFNQDVK